MLKIMVENRNGAMVDFDSAFELMDKNIRKDIADNYCPTSLQEFFSVYETCHKAKYGEEWELSKSNPIYK